MYSISSAHCPRPFFRRNTAIPKLNNVQPDETKSSAVYFASTGTTSQTTHNEKLHKRKIPSSQLHATHPTKTKTRPLHLGTHKYNTARDSCQEANVARKMIKASEVADNPGGTNERTLVGAAGTLLTFTSSIYYLPSHRMVRRSSSPRRCGQDTTRSNPHSTDEKVKNQLRLPIPALPDTSGQPRVVDLFGLATRTVAANRLE